MNFVNRADINGVRNERSVPIFIGQNIEILETGRKESETNPVWHCFNTKSNQSQNIMFYFILIGITTRSLLILAGIVMAECTREVLGFAALIA